MNLETQGQQFSSYHEVVTQIYTTALKFILQKNSARVLSIMSNI